MGETQWEVGTLWHENSIILASFYSDKAVFLPQKLGEMVRKGC